ncbi:alpha/beta hydrolase [Cryptosporangium phraense]|uniref:Alpha/beta hydrolase n=1 Tax=Cryptosporangium phraense TaxID=2593070 RepID=A0A545AML8_9ACTN|nr:alpha/beta hydrolase [Cryptosporangium phraense]TQS42501.1 alpha/beta hydrolase [Cryptosporangium phraense]
MLKRIVAILALTATTTALATACDSEDAAAKSTLAWKACPAQAQGAPPRDPGQQCAEIEVPLDYRHPTQKITVTISKISTAKPDRRRGVLLLNPGGPALPGLDMPSEIKSTLPADVLDRYDLVGFDPRGVGHSTPQSCGLPDPNPLGLFPYPAVDGSTAGNVEYARTVADKCGKQKNLKYFTTANTARDLDRIRQALGEKKISYWGQSYGTYLGTVYASLFEKNTDRVILEGNVDPTKVWSEQVALWGKGMTDRFADAAEVAIARKAGLGSTVPEVTKSYLALVDRLDRTPAAVPGSPVKVDGRTVRNLTYGLLLRNENLPVLVQLWRAAADLADGTLSDADNAVLHQAFADQPPTPGVPADNQSTMFAALTCGDAPWPTDLDEYARKTAADRAAYPLTAGMPANVWPCTFWTDQPIEAPVTVNDDGPRNVLILQNRRDNATPWEGAIGLRNALGRRAGFVGVDNGGHYVYGVGSKCADRATVAFLTHGTLPGRDLSC